MKFVDTMIEKVSIIVDDRRCMIAELLKLEDSQETSRHESEGLGDEALGKLPDNLTGIVI